MEIKVHTEKFKRCHYWASVIPNKIISFMVGNRRLFFHHELAVDRRGTHYGDSCEHLSLIKNPTEYKRLRKQFVRRDIFDDNVIKALESSKTKCLYRSGDISDIGSSKWNELKGGRCYPLEY